MAELHDNLVQLFEKYRYQFSQRPANKRRLLLLQSHCYCYRQNFPHHIDANIKIEAILRFLNGQTAIDSQKLSALISDLIYECRLTKNFDVCADDPIHHFTVGMAVSSPQDVNHEAGPSN